MSAGHEGAPAALRAAGLAERLREIGYDVADLGDDPVQLFQPDNESPRARNLSRVIASLEALKPRVEQAVKSPRAAADFVRRLLGRAGYRGGRAAHFRKVSMIYMDGDADLNTPATTPSGCVDGMVVSHLTGRGAAEMVRFWGEPPLVREPDLAIFGVARLDPPEEQALAGSPLRRFWPRTLSAWARRLRRMLRLIASRAIWLSSTGRAPVRDPDCGPWPVVVRRGRQGPATRRPGRRRVPPTRDVGTGGAGPSGSGAPARPVIFALWAFCMVQKSLPDAVRDMARFVELAGAIGARGWAAFSVPAP